MEPVPKTQNNENAMNCDIMESRIFDFRISFVQYNTVTKRHPPQPKIFFVFLLPCENGPSTKGWTMEFDGYSSYWFGFFLFPTSEKHIGLAFISLPTEFPSNPIHYPRMEYCHPASSSSKCDESTTASLQHPIPIPVTPQPQQQKQSNEEDDNDLFLLLPFLQYLFPSVKSYSIARNF